MKAGFESAIRPSAEAAAEALARVARESSPPLGAGGVGGGVVSVNVDDLAAATAMDVITAFGLGVRSNAVERLGAQLAEKERAKREESKSKNGGEGGGTGGGAGSSPPIPVPEPLIPGAEHTVEAMHAATEAAELCVLWIFVFWRSEKNVFFWGGRGVFFALSPLFSLPFKNKSKKYKQVRRRALARLAALPPLRARPQGRRGDGEGALLHRRGPRRRRGHFEGGGGEQRDRGREWRRRRRRRRRRKEKRRDHLLSAEGRGPVGRGARPHRRPCDLLASRSRFALLCGDR